MTYRLPSDPLRFVEVSSDYDLRYHLLHDKQAASFDTWAISLPPFLSEPGLLAPTFEEALTTLASLRSQPFALLYPPDIWQPMGIIIATSLDAAARDVAVMTARLEAGYDMTDEERARIYADVQLHENGKAHERRVAGLARLVALIRGVPLPKGDPNWGGFTGLQ